jgi:kynureninase
VQYQTGQLFDIQAITAAGKKNGIYYLTVTQAMQKAATLGGIWLMLWATSR